MVSKEVGLPDEALYINPRKTLGILPDGRWQVIWLDAQTKEPITHTHEDIYRVVDQHIRILQRYLGMPVDEARVTAGGEVNLVADIAINTAKAVGNSLQRSAQPLELAQIVSEGSKRIGSRVRNQFKVAALGSAGKGLSSDSYSVLEYYASEFSVDLFGRAREISSIVSALVTRLGVLVTRVDESELPFRRLKNQTGAALREVEIAKTERREVYPHTIEYWMESLENPSGALFALDKIQGNPFQSLASRLEITRLRAVRSVYESGEILPVVDRFAKAYQVLFNEIQRWDDREKAGVLTPFRFRR